MQISARTDAITRHGDFEQYLHDQLGLLDPVSVGLIMHSRSDDSNTDAGPNGDIIRAVANADSAVSVVFVFDTPGGEFTCPGHITQPPHATYIFTVKHNQYEPLFGCGRETLENRLADADTAF